ncbi:ribonuclease H-like domain-containing protein [Tanacetum coccineum]
MATPFANPERQFQARRDTSPAPIHNINTFYESESSKSESKEVGEIDIKTLTLEQYLALNLNNTRRRISNPEDATFTTVSNALADFGASISIMPFSLFKCLGLGNPTLINMDIEMADRSMQSPKGIIENVLVKIKKFIFPTDFIILDITEDEKVPIMLGRPILATAQTRIDVSGKKISLEVGTKQITFDINERKSPAVISHVCVINNFSKINEIDEPRNLEELLMSENIDGDLGSFLKDNDLLPNLDIVENGNAPMVTKTVNGKETVIPPTSIKEKAQRREELKARSTLFGAYERLQKLISQPEMHGEVIPQEDINQKFLRSLLQEWTMHTIMWRNKPEIETLSLDDLFNNLKAYESEFKGTSSSTTSSYNVAFLSSSSSNSATRAVNTAKGVNTASTQGAADSSTTV